VTSLSELRSTWLEQLLSTAPADRPRAEAAVRRLYRAADLAEPRQILWFDSPFRASWVIALLIAPYHQLWSQRLSSGLSRNDMEQLDRARSALGAALGLPDQKATLAAAGAPLGQHLQFPPVPSRMLATKFVTARYTLSDDISGLFTQHGEDDDLARAETYFWGSNRGALVSALHCPTTDRLIGNSFFGDYSFSTIADDEHRAGDHEAPALLAAAWDIPRSSGMWWPFEGVAIMSDRPVELHVNQKYLLHRPDGPAIVFRDGWEAYAWNGKAVPQRWIMQPEAVPPREYKGFDPTFAQHVKGRAAPAVKAKKRAKPASILKTRLSVDPAARLEQLRAHAGGKLPLYDRYQAGAYCDVWRELVSLGGGVREDPYVADALAVAYETMRRVRENVRTVVERLTAMHFTFGMPDGPLDVAVGGPQGVERIDFDQLVRRVMGPGRVPNVPGLPNLANMMAKARDLIAAQGKGKQETRERARGHTPPPPDIHDQIVSFEREFAVLPLSLRTFYEVVGEVNLIGSHPALAPADRAIKPDPLVVYALDDGALEYDEEEDEEAGRPSAITIAPDDLHKANVSGGGAYEMAVPDLRADGELLNERHQLFFVDYLRLAFRFGGFPGYDGAAAVPEEISTLKAGMLEF
jgi:hypothetical protein